MLLLKKSGWKKIARTRNRTLDYDHFKPSFGDSGCISVVTRNLDAFDTRYIRIAEYQPVRNVAGCETLSESRYIRVYSLGYTRIYNA